MTIKIKCKEPGCDKYVKYTPPSAPVLFTLREGNSFLEMTCSDKHTHEYDLTEDVPDDQKDFWLKLAETNIESAHKTINTASSKNKQYHCSIVGLVYRYIYNRFISK